MSSSQDLRPDDYAGAPERIRNERRAGSKYAALENCRYEVNEAELMMKREGIRWLSSTTKSIEDLDDDPARDRRDRLESTSGTLRRGQSASEEVLPVGQPAGNSSTGIGLAM
jgi:hypothetical protein